MLSAGRVVQSRTLNERCHRPPDIMLLSIHEIIDYFIHNASHLRRDIRKQNCSNLRGNPSFVHVERPP